MQEQNRILYAGKPLNQAKKAIIMLHGRGGTAESILSLVPDLELADFAILAPQAKGNTWYPFGFMQPTNQNQPYLDEALNLVKYLVDEIILTGIKSEDIFLLGFSQGACLTLEFSARNAQKFGGIIAFTGGLIGQKINQENYLGTFLQTPVFIGCSDIDPHVPQTRVMETSKILEQMGANVTVKIYPNMPHTITANQIGKANELLRTR